MGWAAGSCVLGEIWDEIRDEIEDQRRAEVLFQLMKIFEDYDCDTLDEMVRDEYPESLEAIKSLYPDYGEEDSDA